MKLRPALLHVLAFVFLASGLDRAGAAAPVVSNVRSVQRAGTQLVYIDYDLGYPSNIPFAVQIAVSTNGGATYDFPATRFSGAVGDTVYPGVGRRIVWNAGLDWPNKFSANVRFRVTVAEDRGMRFIPGNVSFRMGDSYAEGETNELPVHNVRVNHLFMDRCKVTKRFWDEVYVWAIGHGYTFDNEGVGAAASHPVTMVNWYDVVKWCNARSEKSGEQPAYHTGGQVYRTGQVVPQVDWEASGYRLPTEAEWERVARGGTVGFRFPWPDAVTIAHNRANYLSTSNFAYDVSLTQGLHPAFVNPPHISPVGFFAANGFGIDDMAGNVWDWCWDWFGDSYYSSSRFSDPRGPVGGSERVIRGGAYDTPAERCRSAARGKMNPVNSQSPIGFRCVTFYDSSSIGEI